MRYCYCSLGNEKCVSDSGTLSIKNCNNNLEVRSSVEDGSAMIEVADENHWRPFLNKNELSIWTRDESGNRNSYKVYASYDDINAMDLLNVQTDLDYRKEWDQTAVKLDIIETDPEHYANSHLIYWEMQWPKFFANRDYVFSRRYVIDREHNIILIANRGIEHPDYPENKSLIRVRDYWSYMLIMPYTHFDEPGVHFVLTYFDDPGISIPTTLQTWVTEKQMPDFLNRMYEATKRYGSRMSVRNLRTFNQFRITYAYQDKLAKLKKLWKVPTQRSSTPRDLDRDSYTVRKKPKAIEK
ncbi:stAR-related lipid transfer protein 7, mitochondrial-like [Teleopsis dalmanni]|nr:stAR-related lipid transfer protein 7, mitochondrial-like [Teleopsis dalmanni]